MSKSSTAISTKPASQSTLSASATPAPSSTSSTRPSAWSKGPPATVARSSSVSANARSPAPESNPSSGTVTPTTTSGAPAHGKRGSIAVGLNKAGMGHPRSSSVSFGSIDNPPATPTTTTPATAAPTDTKPIDAISAQPKDEPAPTTKKDVPAAAPTAEAESKDAPKDAAAAPTPAAPVKKAKKFINVNALFQTVPQNQPSAQSQSQSRPPSTPRSPSKPTQLPSTSPVPPSPAPRQQAPTPQGPQQQQQHPNGSQIYNSVPMRSPTGPNGMPSQMGPGGMNGMNGMGPNGHMNMPGGGPGMHPGPGGMRYNNGRGGPPGPNGMPRGQGPPPQGMQNGPPGSPRPNMGPGMMMQPMMSPGGVQMPPPGSPWSYYPPMPPPGGIPYHPGMSPEHHQQHPYLSPSPYPQYWPQGMPPPGAGMPPHMQQQGPPQGMPGMQQHMGGMPPQHQQHPGFPPQHQQGPPHPMHQQHPGFMPQHMQGPPQHPGGPMSPIRHTGPMPPQGPPPQQQQQQNGPPQHPQMHPGQGIPSPLGQPPHQQQQAHHSQLPQQHGPPPQQMQQQAQQPPQQQQQPPQPQQAPPSQQMGPPPATTVAPHAPPTGPAASRPTPIQVPGPGTPSYRYQPMGPPTPGSALSGAAPAFVPSGLNRQSKIIKLTKPDGTPLDLSHVRSPSMTLSPGGDEKERVEAVRKPSAPIRIESEDAKKKREREEKEKKDAEEKKARETEERKASESKAEEERKEREKKEEEERVERERVEEVRKVREKKEEEERLKVAAEEEAKAKAVAEAKAKAEAEEKARIEAEAKVKAEAEAKAKSEAEAAALKEAEEKAEQARIEAEAKAKAEAEAKAKADEAEAEAKAQAAAKAKVEEEERQLELEKKRAENAAAADAAVAAEEKASEVTDTLSALPVPSGKTSGSVSPSTPDLEITPQRMPAALKYNNLGNGTPITPTSELSKPRRPVPGPLDLASASAAARRLSAGPLSAMATALMSAKPIEDITQIKYPEGIKSPDAALNVGAKPGQGLRYDRDFLMQFSGVCKDKPEALPPLESIGLAPAEPGDNSNAAGRGGGGPRGRVGSMPPGRGIGLGISGPGSAFTPKAGFQMGQFQTPARTSEDRFRQASDLRSVSATNIGVAATNAFGRPLNAMQRTASTSGLAGNVVASNQTGRSRTPRGQGNTRRDRPEPRQMPSQFNMQSGLEPVAPLQQSATRWVAQAALGRNERLNQDSPEIVERKVKALLNKLTMEKFDSISDQIVTFANMSENERDGHTLIQVIRLVFEKATDEPAWSEMYARLCRKMMEKISPNVMDEKIKNDKGLPIIGGQLFRKYLLNRCQEDFERGWMQRRHLAHTMGREEADTAGPTGADRIFSEEYYAAQKAKRRGLGLIKLIGELFKMQMLTERIMHECLKKMLGNVDTPEEEEIESLCKLMATVGKSIDTVKAAGHLDIYFTRMKEMARNEHISSRAKFLLDDMIELRERKWEPRGNQAQNATAPMTIAEVHAQAAREAEQKAAEARSGHNMSRGGSRRGDPRGDYNHQGGDGWTTAGGAPPRPVPTKAGDLSHFGKINKTSGPIGGFGPSTAFNKRGNKAAESTPTTAPSRNMFGILGSNADTLAEPVEPAKAPSRKPSVDLKTTAPKAPAAADAGAGRKKLKLLPRSVPKADEESAPPSATVSTGEPELLIMSEEKAKDKIEEDVKEFWSVRDVSEAVSYFKDIPTVYHEKLIGRLVSDAFEKREADVVLVADVFSRSAAEGVVSSADFKKVLLGTIELLDDIAVDVPQAYAFMAKLLRGASLSTEDVEELAGKIPVDGEPLVAPKDKLLKEFGKLAA